MKYLTDTEQIKLQYHHKLALKKKKKRSKILDSALGSSSC